MNARAIDVDFEAIRIRDLQGSFYKEHRSLIQWGLWSGDRRNIFPKKAGCSLGPFYKPEAGEEYGDPDKDQPARAELLEPHRSISKDRIPYDEKTAVILDERIHSPGGLGIEVRRSLKVAYVTREVPEAQFWKLSGCSHPDHFIERLEAALRFVRRFI